MGISPFFRGGDDAFPCGPPPRKVAPVDINPDPKKFRIESVMEFGSVIVATVTYSGCTNFEGKKILVFKNMSAARLFDLKVLDPHFSKEENAPFARFEPTPEGLKVASRMAAFLDDSDGR